MDESVIDAARHGDEDAWSIIYRALAPSLAGYFRARRLRDTEDLVGEVFLEMARRIRHFKGDGARLRSWAFTIAHSRYVDAMRVAERRQTQPMEGFDAAVAGPSPEDHALAALEREALVAAADGLTSGQRSVLLLRVIGDLSVEQTATVLGKSVVNVKVTYQRALRALHRELAAGDTADTTAKPGEVAPEGVSQ